MNFPGRTIRSPIGVDVGAISIKAVQLDKTRGLWRLGAAAILDQPVPNHPLDINTVKQLRELLFRQGFSGDEIVLAAPTEQLHVDAMELPPRSSGAPVEQIARMELARTAKLENEPFEIAIWDLPAPARTSPTTSVMAVALPHKCAEEMIDCFEAERYNVIAIDARCGALARACALQRTSQTITAVLDIGWNSALMGLVLDGVLVHQRVFTEAGTRIIFNAIREEFQFGDDETDYVLRYIGVASAGTPGLADIAQSQRIGELVMRHIDSMVDEIQASFQYAAHRYADSPVSTLLLAGGGSNIAGVCEILSARLGVDAKVLAPDGIVQCSPELMARCAGGLMTTALGLALHGAKR